MQGLWIFVAVSVLDLLLTYYILTCGGRELNPFYKRVKERWGLDGMMTANIALTALLGYLFWELGEWAGPSGDAALGVMGGVRGIAVVWNLRIMKKIRDRTR